MKLCNRVQSQHSPTQNWSIVKKKEPVHNRSWLASTLTKGNTNVIFVRNYPVPILYFVTLLQRCGCGKIDSVSVLNATPNRFLLSKSLRNAGSESHLKVCNVKNDKIIVKWTKKRRMSWRLLTLPRKYDVINSKLNQLFTSFADRILLFTLMRIRFWFWNDFSLWCGSWSASCSSTKCCESANTGLQTLHGSILSLHASIVSVHVPPPSILTL